MVDFRPGEKLYLAGIDAKNPERGVGAVFVTQNPAGLIVATLVNGTTVQVPLSSVHKEPLPVTK